LPRPPLAVRRLRFMFLLLYAAAITLFMSFFVSDIPNIHAAAYFDADDADAFALFDIIIMRLFSYIVSFFISIITYALR